MHWSLMEQLNEGKINIEDVDQEQVELLLYNILPGGDTVLHKLSKNSAMIERILQVAHNNPNDRS